MALEKIGDYEIMGSLGKGGFGSVYKAITANGNIVALKVLNPQVLDNQKVVKKFFHEAMILAKLDHPNICRLIEFFPDGQNYAIVMEYVEGTELKDLLQKQPDGLLPFNQAFRVAKQSLSAFQYAHENGILHRDIKPANIMIDRNGNCKIMDFGIAKVTGAATHDTAANMLSVHYTPPERFDPSKTVDARSDIYSLGLVFYEMFAGKRPFNVDDNSQIMFWHLNEIPDPPDSYVSGEGDPTIDYTANVESSDEATIVGDQIITTSPTDPNVSKVKRRKKKGKSIPLVAGITAALVISLVGIGLLMLRKIEPAYQAGQVLTTDTKVPVPEVEGGQLNSKGYYEVTHAKDASVMIAVPAGEFIMGSEKWAAEQPPQRIYLDNYFIDKYLVTNKQFRQFVDETNYVTDAEKDGSGKVRIGSRTRTNPDAIWKIPDAATSIEGKDNYPVTQISYNDAAAYCEWAGKDLPTEAQWEKAARGPDGNEYPWGNSEPDDTMANFDRLVGETTPVNQYAKGQSYYGAFDMAGNVNQWCKDWYGEGERQARNPTGPETGSERVIKGGSFDEGIDSLRSSNRNRFEPNYSSFLFGFRCVKKME